MTDELVHGRSKIGAPDSAGEEEPTADSLSTGIVIKGGNISIGALACGSGSHQVNVFTPETVALVTAVAIFSKAFLETLGQRTGEGVASLPKRVGDLVRIRKQAKKGKPDEYVIGVGDSATAMIFVTEDLPDEARLALLDLDVTAETLRGKLLRWDVTASAWRPDDEGLTLP
jgi:hypothetical protein